VALQCEPVTRLQDVWVCAADLQLIRADRIVSLLVPIAAGYGAASPADRLSGGAVFAEIDGSAKGDTPTRVKVADCGKSPAGELMAGLAHALGSAGTAQDNCMFVFANQETTGRTRWIVTGRFPQAWPQSTSPHLALAVPPERPRAD
jgi:hypothetical protein